MRLKSISLIGICIFFISCTKNWTCHCVLTDDNGYETVSNGAITTKPLSGGKSKAKHECKKNNFSNGNSSLKCDIRK